MTHLIDKSALVAEIEKRIEALINKKEKLNIKTWNWSIDAEIKDYESILSFLDTLEVKEVDLEKECSKYFETMKVQEYENIFESTFNMIAKHFFELGLQVAQKGE